MVMPFALLAQRYGCLCYGKVLIDRDVLLLVPVYHREEARWPRMKIQDIFPILV